MTDKSYLFPEMIERNKSHPRSKMIKLNHTKIKLLLGIKFGKETENLFLVL